MRDEDKKEVWSSHGMTPLEAMKFCYDTSKAECNTIMHKGNVCAMFGVAPSPDGNVGHPWLLGNEYFKDVPKIAFVKQSKQFVKDQVDKYGCLTNYVHFENTVSIQWLKYIGFSITKLIEDYGVNPEPFYEFVKVKDVCNNASRNSVSTTSDNSSSNITTT